jgi:hypothetical protein
LISAPVASSTFIVLPLTLLKPSPAQISVSLTVQTPLGPAVVLEPVLPPNTGADSVMLLLVASTMATALGSRAALDRRSDDFLCGTGTSERFDDRRKSLGARHLRFPNLPQGASRGPGILRRSPGYAREYEKHAIQP